MFFCKPKICNYSIALTHKNVGQFEITMKESFITHFYKPTYNIFENFESFWLAHSALLFDQIAQVSFITVFSDDVTMRRLSNDIKALENVAMVQSCECLDLTVQHFTTDWVLDSFHINGFDCNGLIWIRRNVLVRSLVPL